jgi:RPA family protein
MPGLDEGTTVWRMRVKDPAGFDKFRVKEIAEGVKITLGRVKGSDRWTIQNYMFDKTRFKTREQVNKWYEEHVKSETKTAMDFRVWNEYRKMALDAYMEISHISQ